MSDLQRVGPVWGGSGTAAPFTAGISGGQRMNDAHARFMDAALANRIFSTGMGLTAINNATFTTGTLGATCTPIAGIWVPPTATVCAVLLQANLGVTITALAATGGGPYAWAYSAGNSAISTGSTPVSRKTLTASGAQAKGFANVALTGLTNNLVVMGASSLGGGSASNASFTATAVAMQTGMMGFVENIDGSIIVPPGGVIALLATTTPVAHSAASLLLFEEVPILA